MQKKFHLRIACVQLNAGANWKKNWRQTQKQILSAVRLRAEVIVLPENFIVRAAEPVMASVEREAVPFILSWLKTFAKKRGVTIVAGSVPEIFKPLRSKKFKIANTCFVFSAGGDEILRYRKMHLFDVNLPHVKVKESKFISPGKTPGFFKLKGIGMGVGICYDLRFPEYFRVLSAHGAEVFFIPSNFTAETGKTAWEVLLRARAIENQCYVVAPGQCGLHPGSGIMSYGNSMIVNPLGKILKRASFSTPRVLIADINLTHLGDLRRRFPVLKHRKISRFSR